jgi:hypothetical protein
MMENLKTNSGPSLSVGVGLLSLFYGVPVYLSPHVVQHRQFRFPKSKKFRIRKKWTKLPKNFKTEPGMLMADHDRLYGYGGKVFYIHPDLAPKLEDAIKRKNEAHERE